jgi:hypothetical protein
MPEYTISDKDLRDAEAFLVQFQSEQVPTANLEVGGAMRDLLIKGFAALYAFLRGEIDRVTARQSLLRIQSELTDDDDIAQAVDELLSNFFITRRGGEFARMPGRFHFTEKQAYSISLASRFWRTNDTVFYIDSASDPYVITEQSLFPVYDASGTLVDYVVDIPMIAARAGEGYNIGPGKFVRAEVPGGLPYYSYAENTEEASEGKDVESSNDLIARADTSLSERNLINNRSCDVVLKEAYPQIQDTLTIGMGEPEMIRDRREEIAQHIQLHIGGHYDTYLEVAMTTTEEIGIVGGFFPRPDGVVNVFRDPYLTYDLGRTFQTVLGVQPGHTLRLRSGFAGLPRGFLITRVSEHELEVSENTPFPVASDEESTNAVVYSIGWLSPGFEEILLEAPSTFYRTAEPSLIAATENVPYGTSRRIQQPGKIVLNGNPVQDISWVEITDPPGASTLIDPTTATLVFHNRINMQPVQQSEAAYTQFQVQVHNPEKAQSVEAVNSINVGYAADPSVFDGRTLRVVYQTLQVMRSVHLYVRDRDRRIACANQLVRGRHPVWLEMVVPYQMKKTTDEQLDEEAASKTLADMVNNFDSRDDLNISDISLELRTKYPLVGAVYDIELWYHLDAPDGQQVLFSTTDLVSIFLSDSNSVTWENEDDVTIPPEVSEGWWPGITQAEKLQSWFIYLGVSDRTVRYRSAAEMIALEVRS